MEGLYHVSIARSVTKADRQGSLNLSAMSAHCPVSGHDRAIYDAGCSSGVTIGVKPVGELGQPLVQPAPELNAGGHRWRRLDRAQTRDVLVANPAVLPAVLNQAHCQPIGRLAKVHEHCSGTTIRARFLPSEAGPLLAAPASSWRTTCHSITSSARATAKRRCWIHPPVISCTSRLTGKPAWARTL